MKNFLIDILAFGTLFSSVLVITSKNPVIAVVFLISTFVNAAGYLIMTGVGFIGLAYILLYVGAIAVLMLFVLMMINIKLSEILETGSQYRRNLPLALCVGGLFIYEIFTILPFSINNVPIISALLDLFTNLNGLLLNSEIASIESINTAYNPVIADTTFTNFLQIEAIGQALYTYGSIWLIITSVILLLSMIAAIVISRNNKS